MPPSTQHAELNASGALLAPNEESEPGKKIGEAPKCKWGCREKEKKTTTNRKCGGDMVDTARWEKKEGDISKTGKGRRINVFGWEVVKRGGRST